MSAVMILVYLLTSSAAHVYTFTLSQRGAGCRISLNQDLPSNPPLIINETGQLLYPSENDTIVVETNTAIVLYCQTGFSDRKVQGSSIRASCKQGATVTYNGNSYHFSQLGCNSYMDSTIKRNVGSCAGNHSLIDIGYEYTLPGGLNFDSESSDENVNGNHNANEEEEDVEYDDVGLVDVEEVRATIKIEQKEEHPKTFEFRKTETNKDGASSADTGKISSLLNFMQTPTQNLKSNGGLTEFASSENITLVSGEDSLNTTGTGIKENAPFKVVRQYFKEKQRESKMEWIKLIQVCYDFDHHTTLYSLHSLDKRIRGRQRSVKRPYFKPDIFEDEGIDVNFLYSRNGQIRRLTKVLGSEDLAKKYIQTNDHFLARGHYSPKADFIFGTEQTATFYYINVAPQWQTFNGGNWVQLENAVRDLMIAENGTVQVYTGTYGVISLKDIDEKFVEIYLGEKDGRQIIPVPKYYWKVIYSADKQQGVAIVGINNPYLEVSEDDILCEDISRIHPWIDWDLKNQEKGYIFCCMLAEFQQKFIDLGLESAP